MKQVSRRIRVLLVDDHAVVRAGYRILLKNSPEIDVVAEADSGESACAAFSEINPDVVVMDLTLPGMSGLEAIQRIVARAPGARILVFSMHEDPMFAERALANGARGYITKRSAPAVLGEAIRQVDAGLVYIDAKLAQRLAAQKARGEDSELAGLSTREFEIFCLFAEGVGSNEIGKRLNLSPKTVANYGSQIKGKLQVSSMAEFARLAIRHGIVIA
jgi:DNA-binding NarL/FixJ family response regulator